MDDPAAEPRRLTLADLRDIVTDAGELAKGVKLADHNALGQLSRYQRKLFGDVFSSSGSPYKVTITFGETGEIKARCGCMAARTRPFCKHASALLVSWARAPEAFVTSDAPPVVESGPTRKNVRKGKADAIELKKTGVEQVATLLRELSLSGIATVSGERPEQVSSLAETLRANGLRRLAGKTRYLGAVLDEAALRTGEAPSVAFSELIADMLLTVRKLEKHLAGEPLEDRHVEELIGKTWTKKDRAPIGGLQLLEYFFSTRITADDFVIRESRFIDLASGRHYSEKQIVPGFLRNVPPKRSRAGRVLVGGGGVYPGFPPLRLDLDPELPSKPLDAEALHAVVERALPDTEAVLAAFQEHRRDVFAPDRLPIAMRVDALFADGTRLLALDASGRGVMVSVDAGIDEAIARHLESAMPRAILGELELSGALLTLVPRALVTESKDGLGLALLPEELARPDLTTHPPKWTDQARAIGASSAAIALGEVREELAELFSSGVASLIPRATDALSARLSELGLAKQAQLLDALARHTDPAERLDDFVKLYQVLGIALVRLAGTVQIDVASLETMPTHPGVRVRSPDALLDPAAVAIARKQRKLSRYEASFHLAKHFASAPRDELLTKVVSLWSNGSAAPFIAAALATAGADAIAPATRALSSPVGLTAQLTAVRILERSGDPAATLVLERVPQNTPAWRAMIAALSRKRLEGSARRKWEGELRDRVASLSARLTNDRQKESRVVAAEELAASSSLLALPALRRAFWNDAARDVRRAAASALAQLGDSEMLDAFIEALTQREDEDLSKDAAYALGTLGDVRGVDVVLDAAISGWRPAVVVDALQRFGLVALEPLLRRVDAKPEIADRKSLASVIEKLPAAEVIAAIEPRISNATGEQLVAYLKLVGNRDALEKRLAAPIEARASALGDKAAMRAAARALRPKKKA